ncbi:V-type ATP synthase subunit I [Halobaculum roseum]|uniref:A-type ATP synthase subunit I n=1 Tax=Halobaculum roseum TaxID=2175149 RepID=A0ABD5MV70_9EURY|nr:V-type ATP synthase subunit I [Halobaculum roseum]QZY02240.1 V-type ATP synthase subunit I [Halobaculum roseum]
MLRPERMSKVSVTGSKAYMESVIEAVHELNLLHVTEYGGGWEGFVQGNPQSGAEDAADKLVTVRSLKSMLGVEDDEAGPTRVLDDGELTAELEELREEVNALDDRRDEIRSQLRSVEERIEAVEPFAELGIDLDLLQGYDSLQVAVGEGDRDAVERAVLDAPGLTEYQVFGDDVIAVFARPERDADESALTDALVSAEFAAHEVPDVEGDSVSPEAYVDDLESQRQSLESDLESVEAEIEAVRADAAGFLLAAEEKLAIEVQKSEAPLSYATTRNAFVAEGWIPTDSYTEFKSAVQDAVGSHVEIEEIERASFGADGEVQVREDVPPAVEDAGREEGAEATGDGESEQRRAVADGGGSVVMRNDDPPVVQDNPGLVSPFEVLVQAVGRPNYREFDPSVILFLTFPAFFGFMIGDLGYGILYTAIGYFLYSNFDSKAFKSMGGVTIAAGLFTAVFGVFYGEFFGLHVISTYFWEGVVGLSSAPIHKGLQPADIYWAQAWLVVSTVVALFHLNIGYVFGFLEELEFHGAKAAITEKGSWLLGMNGLWLFVFSRLYEAKKPAFIFTVFDGSGAAPEASGEFASTAFALGFNGFSPTVGMLGLGLFALGALLLVLGAPAEILEIFDVLVNVLSYTRIAAVLLAKAGMAFVVNLLFFGAYQTADGEFHFMLTHGPEYYAAEYGREAIMFGGLVHGGAAALVGGLVILVLGHLLVLALGVTSAGLQAVRLEYYEFFSKFFEGGGTEYEPFGSERRFTVDE